MDDRGFLGKRRDRAIATILSYKERECDDYLSDNVSQGLRKVILDQINDLCDLAFDMLNNDIILNDEFLDRLEAIYDNLDKES